MLGEERDPERAEQRQRLGRLRREAFGRATTPDEESRAAAALHELNALEAELRAAELRDRQGATRSPDPDPGASTEPSLLDAPAPAPAPPTSLHNTGRLRRILPIVVVGVVSAALGVGLAAVTLNPAADASPPGAPNSEPGALQAGHDASPIRNDADIADGDIAGGDIAVAQRWFDKTQTPDDLVDLPNSMLDLATTRLVQSNSGLWRILVARDEDDQYCLIIDQPKAHMSAFTCRPPDGFTASGLRVTNGEITAYWDGFTISTSVRPAE